MADFASHAADYEKAGVRLVAFSADDEEHARSTRDRHEIPFPLGHSVDAAAFSEASGCFYDAEKGYLHACGFLVAPDGTVATAVYSSGGVGRLKAEEALGQVKHLRGDD